MGLYNKWELNLKDRVSKIYLNGLLKIYGIQVKVRKSRKDVYSKVYGIESGELEEGFEVITAIIVSDTFDAVDSTYTGLFDEGWLYTDKEELISVGDVVEIDRADGKQHLYKVIRKEAIGLTTEVMTKFRLSSYHNKEE